MMLQITDINNYYISDTMHKLFCKVVQ